MSLARLEDAWQILVGDGNRRISLVVFQQNVVSRFVAFDQIVLQQKRILICIDHDIFNVPNFTHQKSCLGALLVFVEIRADASLLVLGLAHIYNRTFIVQILVAAGTVRKIEDYPFEVLFKRLCAFLLATCWHLKENVCL